MIYDVFPFFNEFDLLDIRLHELWDVVDYFVLCEATRTHSGQFKPLYYQGERLGRFHPFMKKIIPVTVTDMPFTKAEIKAAEAQTDGWVTGDLKGDNWVRERYQRDAMQRVLKDVNYSDIIILGDADEIVRAEVVDNLDTMLPEGLVAVGQTLHSYYLNWKCTNMPWAGTKIFRRRYMTTLSEQRFHTPPLKTISCGGWHFSYMGGLEAIRTKVRAFAHSEFNTPEILNRLGWRLKDRQDALGRLYEYEIVPIDNSYPKYVVDNLDKFDALDWIY